MTTRDYTLTSREKEIIALIAEGLTDREIAAQVGLSKWTVKEYVGFILQKLYLRNRVQVAAYAVRELGL